MSTAKKLIARSISHDEIVHAPFTPETAEDLGLSADESVENGDVVEYWGVDDDGQPWRVHLDRYI